MFLIKVFDKRWLGLTQIYITEMYCQFFALNYYFLPWIKVWEKTIKQSFLPNYRRSLRGWNISADAREVSSVQMLYQTPPSPFYCSPSSCFLFHLIKLPHTLFIYRTMFIFISFINLITVFFFFRVLEEMLVGKL